MNDNPITAYGAWLAEAPRDWPAEAVQAAQRCFIDVSGVAVRGAAEAPVRLAFETVRRWGEGPCAAIGTGARLAAPWAAFVNGTAAHALDFDDNFEPAKAHASAVLAPAILALGEQEGASGADCIDAYVAGLQIMGRVGEGLNPVHRFRGWHATATIGALGAAAACARLLRLGQAEAAHALSIATSMAGGFMSQFGSMTKPVHAGLAAQAGVTAASLARSGIDAAPGTLDGPFGMARLMVGPDYEEQRETLGGRALRFETEAIGTPLLILEPGLKVKRFPNCASAHRAMDALLHLRARHGFGPDVREIVVRAPRSHLANLAYRDPRTVSEARFSLEFPLAMLLVEGECGLSRFTDSEIGRDDVRALYPRIRRELTDDPLAAVPTEVEVVLQDGRRLSEARAMAVGSIAAPFTLAQQWEKFEGCVASVLPDERARKLRTALEKLPALESLRELTEPLLG